MLRAVAIRPASNRDAQATSVFGTAVLQHDERHLRRKAIKLTNGSKILVDLPEPVVLNAGDELVLDNEAIVLVAAADEALYEITGHNEPHLTRLAWHIGNRHLAAAIEADKILILRDHVIKAMLIGLDATVGEIIAPFNPMRGAYAGHESSHQHPHDTVYADHHDHGHQHHHHHDRTEN